MELDHLFIRALPGAPEAQLLLAAGLLEGSGNRHPGQGTANRRFFFENAFLELLWIDDEAEVCSEATARTQLAQRLGGANDASPFGVCFRPSPTEQGVPFSTWAYRPGYLPAGMQVDIADDAPLEEPMWFYLEEGSAPEHAPAARRQPMIHTAGVRRITSVTITLPAQPPYSDAAQASDVVTLRQGDEHLMEICCDHGAAGKRFDCRPGMPLVMTY